QPTELFPTPVRSAGIAFIQTFNRLGTIVSPLVFIPSKHWPPAPFLLMLITSATDFLLYFFLVPETRGKKLPDNMPGEEYAHESRTQSTDSTKDAKIEGEEGSTHKITSSALRQDKKKEAIKKGNKVEDNNGEEKESNNDDEKKMEEKGKRGEDGGDGEKKEEEKEGRKQQNNNEESKQEKSKTESSKNEERKGK
ncbi:unnamed protein product, partial [Wuchereria bancrofti]